MHKSLKRHGFNAAALHGDLDQRARMAALDSFRTGDVALPGRERRRGPGSRHSAVSHVFNYDVPHHAEDYVHRIGRTGRAGLTAMPSRWWRPGTNGPSPRSESLMGQAVAWEGPKPEEGAARERRPARRSRGARRPERRCSSGPRKIRAAPWARAEPGGVARDRSGAEAARSRTHLDGPDDRGARRSGLKPGRRRPRRPPSESDAPLHHGRATTACRSEVSATMFRLSCCADRRRRPATSAFTRPLTDRCHTSVQFA